MPSSTTPLREAEADPDPFDQFARWYEDAAAAVEHPENVAVASADAAGHPSVRMVLLKSFDRHGFVFFTNYAGRKGRELAANPHGALLFFWEPLGRQVRVEGTVERVSAADSDAYFATRPRGAQVAAHASRQSEPVADRDQLDLRARELAAAFEEAVPRPSWWGGYRLVPVVFEFWQNREDRLHDRLRYVRDGAAHGWRRERLQP